MNTDTEMRKVILDNQTAIDLMIEQLGILRRSLDGILVRVKPPLMPSLANGSPRPVGWRRRDHKKGPRTTLHILIDGFEIAEPQAKAGLMKAIEHVGVNRVYGLSSKLSGRPLIVRGMRPSEGAYHQCGEYWIATHSDTGEKRKVLEEICERLGLSHSIRQVNRNG
jgi:hypothetical protein